MRSSRTAHSVASDSSRSYLSSKTRHRSCSSAHLDEAKKPTRKMKIIIAIGIALPIIAAIIGVVAWAVSADTGFQGHIVSSMRRSDEHNEDDIFQALEDRHDIGFSRQYSPPNQDLQKHDFSRLDGAEGHDQFDDTTNKDPLYVVHFVPSPRPKTEASTDNNHLASTVSNDVLQKILSASKGTKPGTPQFVVFAPIPGEEDAKTEASDLKAGSLSIGSQGVNLFSKKKLTPQEIDYDYEEELRKYQELLASSDRPQGQETSRVGQTKEKSHTKVSHEELLKLITKNLTSGNSFQTQHPQTLSPNLNTLQSQNYQQQAVLNPQQNYVNSYQGQSQQNYPQSVPQSYAPQSVQQAQTYDQYPQQYYPQESSHSHAQTHPQAVQPHATDRSGYQEPVGIRLNFGSGSGKSLLGGNYSPLGIIGSVLKSILPRNRPQVNLNGKLMFGVMLENGVKFGDKKHQQHYG